MKMQVASRREDESVDIPWAQLIEQATQARERAYAPYSKFKVGAAALFETGFISAGCNVENSSYGLALCAERNAIGHAVAQGHSRLLALAIVTDSAEPCPPCGMCRQVMAEFARPDVPVVSRTLDGKERRSSVGALLPEAFSKDFL